MSNLMRHTDDPIILGVLWLLLGLSTLSWTILLWKFIDWFCQRWRLRQSNTALQSHIEQLTLPDPKTLNGHLKLLITDLIAARTQLCVAPHSLVEPILSTHLNQALDKLRLGMEIGLTWLATIASIAPFVGLFGTVWGVYLALQNISEQQTAALTVVAGPMGEALVATAAGLFAAIPALLAYNGLLRLNKIQEQSLRHIAERLQFACLPNNASVKT